MSEHYLSPALRGLGALSLQAAPLIGVEEQIYDRLWRAILAGQLRPGAKLKEDVVGETFEVSRTVVRKVLVIMEQQGIVELPVNRGAYVATPKPEDAKATFEAARLVISHVVGELAAPGREITLHERQGLEAHMAVQKAAEDAGNFVETRILAGEFHLLLTHIHGNALLAGLFDTLMVRLNMIFTLYQVAPVSYQRHAFQKELTGQILRNEQAAAVATVQAAYRANEQSLRFDPAGGDVDLRTILTGQVDVQPTASARRQARKAPKKAALDADGTRS